MSALDHIRKVSESVVHDNWHWTPIAYDSVPFDSAAQSSFIRHTLLPGDSFQSAMPACVRYSGIVAINLFTPQNLGTKDAYLAADNVAALYSHKTIEGIIFYGATTTRVGYSEDFFQLSVFIPYQYDTQPLVPVVPVTYLGDEITHNGVPVFYA